MIKCNECEEVFEDHELSDQWTTSQVFDYYEDKGNGISRKIVEIIVSFLNDNDILHEDSVCPFCGSDDVKLDYDENYEVYESSMSRDREESRYCER